MSKQDRQGVRTARDLEQKYGFGQSFSEVKESLRVATETAEQAKKQASKAHSEVLQLSDSIKLTVENGETTAQIKLKVGDKEIPATIDMKGLVTFANLAKADGTTVINGSNITTGQILADLIKAGTIKSKDGKSLVINLDSGKSSFTTTAEVFLEPGQFELDVISMVLEQGLWDTSQDETLYDRDGDGVITSTDYQYFWNAMNGKKSLADGWDKAQKSTVTITIDPANAEKAIRIQGTNMWGREIDAYIGANGISSASNIDMHGGKVKNLSWDLDLENNDAISKYFADTHYAPNGYGYGTVKPKYIDDANDAILTGIYHGYGGGIANVPPGFEGGFLECQAFGPANYFYSCIHIIRNDNSVAIRYGNASFTGETVTWSDWRDITYGLPKVGNELVSPVDIKAPNFYGRASSVYGEYTSNGGAQGPSYVGAYNVRFNMMNQFPGVGGFDGYADVMMMNAYCWSDVPYATALAIQKNGGVPRAWIASGGNSSIWGGSAELITSANIGSQSVNYASSAGNADTLDGYHASAFAPVASPTNLLHAGNEFTYVPDAFSGDIWHNYRTANMYTNGNITGYYFGNGKGSTAGVTLYADNFSGKLNGRKYKLIQFNVPSYSTSGSNGYNYYGDVSVSGSFGGDNFSDTPCVFLQCATPTTGVIALEPVSYDYTGVWSIRIHRSSSASNVAGFSVYCLAVI